MEVILLLLLMGLLLGVGVIAAQVLEQMSNGSHKLMVALFGLLCFIVPAVGVLALTVKLLYNVLSY